jgi:hypothetical protein
MVELKDGIAMTNKQSAAGRFIDTLRARRPLIIGSLTHVAAVIVGIALGAALAFPLGASWGVYKLYNLVSANGEQISAVMMDAAFRVKVASDVPDVLSYHVWGSGFSAKNWDEVMKEAGVRMVKVKPGEEEQIPPVPEAVTAVATRLNPGDPPDDESGIKPKPKAKR